MKNFEPIVIQKETVGAYGNAGIRIVPNILPVKTPQHLFDIEIVNDTEDGNYGLTREAAIRLRDALNKILQD